MKFLLTIGFFAFTLVGNAQIISNDQQPVPKVEKKQQKEKETKKEKAVKEKTGLEIYFGVTPSYTFRTLKINEGLFAAPLSYREKEKASWLTSYEIGIKEPLSKHFKLGIGAGFYLNGEHFSYETKDSVFNYINTYRQLSFPFRIIYSYGKKVSFYAGLGIVPTAFFSLKHEETKLDINKQKKTTKNIVKDHYNSFLVSGIIDIGMQYKFSRNVALFIALQGRRQFISNYERQFAYIRKPYALGLNIGLSILL